jgi:molecular chaperone DnaK
MTLWRRLFGKRVQAARPTARKSEPTAAATPPLAGQRPFVCTIVGIDLGTTNSCVAVMATDGPRVIENSEGMRKTPSIVAFTPDGERLVGAQAERQAALNPERTIFAVKRMVGRRYDDRTIEKYREFLPYQICKAGNDDVWIQVDGKSYPPSQISAFILQKMKATAEAHLGHKVEQAVVTVPAYFNMTQRQATKDAGKIAGLEVLRVISESTAAAITYGLTVNKSGTIAIYDLGAGHFNISILEIGHGVFEVKSTNGDMFLGGEDFDMRLVDYLAGDFQKTHGIDLRRDKAALQRLKAAAERVKIELSSTMQTEINLPFIATDARGPKSLSTKLTRPRFEALVGDLVEKTVEPCRQALKDADLSARDISEVVLVGGMTRMPKVQELVRQLFGREPHKGVNPDEAVALGAAIEAGVLQGNVKDVLLLDITPLSLGIETRGGAFIRLIDRNTTIPTKKAQVFSTAKDGHLAPFTTKDGKTAVTIRVFEGERDMAAHNKLLGQFDLFGLSQHGASEIEVTFDIDANDTLNVHTKDYGTGKEQQIRLQASGRLPEADIQRMIKDAEADAEKNDKREAQVEIKNYAEALIHSTEKGLAEHGPKIGESERRAMENAIADLKQALKCDDPGIITAKTNVLVQASMKLGEAIYKAALENAEDFKIRMNAADVAAGGPPLRAGQAPSARGRPGQSPPVSGRRPGELLGGIYPVARSLGRGSFGEVFLCRHPAWSIEIAVKVPYESTLADPRALSDLQKEAEEWTGLGLHPNIAYCYHLHRIADLPLLVVEYVAGGTLRQRIESDKAAVHDLRGNLDVAMQLCHALEHAHGRGLVHRDVTPENIMLAADGTPKLTDFGITKRGAVTDCAIRGLGGAQQDIFAGRRGYMAPEQAIVGARVDARADLFALGACLYELFCFCLPYTITEGPRQEPVRPRDLRRDGTLPDGLEQLLLQLVTWEPDGRPANAKAVREELAAIYSATLGEASPYAVLPDLQLTASSHNNRGVSYHFLGKHDEAQFAIKEALAADPLHPEAIYNLGLIRWRKAEITDYGLVTQLNEIRSVDSSWRPAYLLGLVHLERRDREAAIKLLEEACAVTPKPHTNDALTHARAMPETESTRCISTFGGHVGSVLSVAFSPDGRLALSGSEDATLRVLEIVTGRCLCTFEGHTDNVTSVAFSPEGRQLLSGSNDSTLRLWDVATSESLGRFEGHSGAVTSVAFSPDGRQALSASWDTTLHLWDVATRRRLRSLERHWRSTTSVKFSPDGRQILSGSADGTLRLWDVATGRCLRTFSVNSPVEAVAFSPDGRQLVSGSDDETVRLWDATTGLCLRTFEGHASIVTSVTFLQNAGQILSGSWDNTLRLWEVASGRCLRTLEGHTNHVTSAAFFPARRQILSSSRDQTLRLWELGRPWLDWTNRGNLQLVRPEPFADFIGRRGAHRRRDSGRVLAGRR